MAFTFSRGAKIAVMNFLRKKFLTNQHGISAKRPKSGPSDKKSKAEADLANDCTGT